MAEKTEQQLTEELIQKQVERQRKFSKGVDTETPAPMPKPNPEADAGAPKSGWRRLIENVTKDIIGR